MNAAEKELIAKAVCESMESMGAFAYLTSDGEDNPDVEVWPFPLRAEGRETDHVVFARDFCFDLAVFLEQLESILDRTVALDDLLITYAHDGLDVIVLGKDLGAGLIDSESSLWISILNAPPKEAAPRGTLTRAGAIVYDEPNPSEN